ncbi:MAG: hypothetical protein ACI4IF_05340 [Acutalibacteraceae bacterium]
MKQSTKLLSLVLALVMALSCFSVIASAEAATKATVSYDVVDDAILSPTQVATIVVDLLDELLLDANIETMDLSILGELRMDSVDHILADVSSLRGSFYWTIGNGLLGNIADLKFKALTAAGDGKDYGSPIQRSHGDLQVLYHVLNLVCGQDDATNPNIIAKAVYGLDTSNGIDLGLIGNFMDTSEINEVLTDIPGMLKEMVYDGIIHGSYGYDEKYAEGGSDKVAGMDIADIANLAVRNLLTNPQEYERDAEGNKVWDMNSVIVPGIGDYIDVNNIDVETASVFSLLDMAAQCAIDLLGVPALNNNLKKQLLEAVEVDFYEIDEAELPAATAAKFAAEEDYVTYISYDCLNYENNTWYYTTLKNRVQLDSNGDPIIDEETGKEVVKKERIYYKGNVADANDFYSAVNWDWHFVSSKSSEAGTVINYQELIETYGSLFGSLNHLVYIVYDVAVSDEAKADFESVSGTGWVDGDMSNFNANLTTIGKYLLTTYGTYIFGKNSPYAHYTWDDVASWDLVDAIVAIGPSFFQDAMPQIIMPVNEAGEYDFGTGAEIVKFGALVLRELITEVAPTVNYDDYIFVDGNLTNRQFINNNDEQYWIDLILNMGIDVGYTYLNNLTNFNTATPAVGVDEARWKGMLDTAITWAVNYAGATSIKTGDGATLSDTAGSYSILQKGYYGGFDPDTVAAIGDPVDKLSYFLNNILPLGFVSGLTGSGATGTYTYAVDAYKLIDVLKAVVTDFDLEAVLGLFGREHMGKTYSTDGSDLYNYNILNAPLVTMVVDLVNHVLGGLFGNGAVTKKSGESGYTGIDMIFGTRSTKNCVVNGWGGTEDITYFEIDTAITQANLADTISVLLQRLGQVKASLLSIALPIAAKFVSGWGTEQEFKVPDVKIQGTTILTNGAGTQTLTVKNGSEGIWRGYLDGSGNRQQDDQYKIVVDSVAVQDFDGNTLSTVSVDTAAGQTLDFGGSQVYNLTISGVPTTGQFAKFIVTYRVFGETGEQLGGQYTETAYSWLSYNKSNAKAEALHKNGNNDHIYLYSPWYVPVSTAAEYISNAETTRIRRDDGSGVSPTFAWQTYESSKGGNYNSDEKDGLVYGYFDITNYSSVCGIDVYLKNFQTYQMAESFENDDGKTGSVSWNMTGSVNEANLITALAGKNVQGGATTVFSVYIKSQYKPVLQSTKKAEGTANLEFRYYDDITYKNLKDLVEKEVKRARKAAEYTTGVFYTSQVVDYSEEESLMLAPGTAGNTELAVGDISVPDYVIGDVWLDANGNEVAADSAEAVKEVTKVNGGALWTAYYNALKAALPAAYQVWNDNSVYNFDELYAPLFKATRYIDDAKLSASEIEGGESIDSYVVALESRVESLWDENGGENFDYSDYKMYRWNRYTSQRKDAYKIINAYHNANAVIETQEFPYADVTATDLRTYVAGNQYEAEILALLEDMDAEAIKAQENARDKAADGYAGYTAVDVVMSYNLVGMTADRLIKRDGGVNKTALSKELGNAEAAYNGGVNSGYSDRSWARFEKAYQAASAVNADASAGQKQCFDAKYELMVAWNQLKTVEEEADYTELEALMAQAETALANESLYSNDIKDFGKVVAELGIERVNDNSVELFNGSALMVNNKSYSVDDQKKVDGAATALKEALARLKFKDVAVTGVDTAEEVLVPADDKTGTEEVRATVSRIAQGLVADDVKTLISTGVVTDNAFVTDDVNYALLQDVDGVVGTNCTVTFYRVVDGIDIPVATVKLVVNGDVNGDGFVDVLDASKTELVSNSHGSLQGCYFLAGNLGATDADNIEASDLQAVVNIAIA